MKTCPSCSQTVADHLLQCPGCGQPLLAESTGAASRRPPVPPPPPGKPAGAPPPPPIAQGSVGMPPPPKKRPPPPGPVRGAMASAPSTPLASQPSTSSGGANPLKDWRVWGGAAILLAALVVLWRLSSKTEDSGQLAQDRPVPAAGQDGPGQGSPSAAAGESEAGSAKGQDTPEPTGGGEGGTSRKPIGPAAPGAGNEAGKEPGPASAPSAKPRRTATFSLYELRTDPDRGKKLTVLGGSAESEGAVAAGLEWLARHQAEDGHWGPECLGRGEKSRCQKDGACQMAGGQHEMALSGLALLAFQAGGHYDFNRAKHSENVKKGLDWMVAHQRDDGGLVGSTKLRGEEFPRHFMYEHGMAAFALAEACAVAKATGRHIDEKYLGAAEKAIRFIQQQQHADGGWRYTTEKYEASDTSVSGWQVLAIKSAAGAGIAVDGGCIEGVKGFFRKCEIPRNGRTGYQGQSQITEATTGVGMLVHQFLLKTPDSPMVREAAPYLADFAEREWGMERHRHRGSPDFYLWYNCTLAMQQAGGAPWERWNRVVRDRLVDLQKREGCPRGSWDPTDRWGGSGGRVYSTALAILILEVYYRFAKEEPALTAKQL